MSATTDAVNTDAASVFAAVEERIAADPGVRLFTVLQWLPEIRTLRRVASNRPLEYPVGAEKSLEVSGGWLDAVIRDRRTFFGATDAEVAAVFADVDLIRSLGCGAVINAPIVEDGVVLGTLAILDAEGAYDERSVATVEAVVAEHAAALAAAFRQLDSTSSLDDTPPPDDASPEETR